MNDLFGIHAALLTPFDKDENIDAVATEGLLRLIANQGLSGIYVGGSTGEAVTQSVQDRASYLRLVSELCSENLTKIAHIGAIATRDAIHLANVAGESGYDAISAITPYYYSFTREEVLSHYRAIADQAKLPLIIYNFPAISSGFSLDEMRTLLSHPNIIGVKHTSSDFYALLELRQLCPDAIIYNGYDEMCLAGLVFGAQGAIGSTYNFMGDLFVAIMNSVKSNDLEDARQKQIIANHIISVLIDVGVINGCKAIVSMMGVPMGRARLPFRDISAADLKRLEASIQPLMSWRNGQK